MRRVKYMHLANINTHTHVAEPVEGCVCAFAWHSLTKHTVHTMCERVYRNAEPNKYLICFLMGPICNHNQHN